MIPTVFAYLLVALLIVSAYPWATWLLDDEPRETRFVFRAVLTLALSLGTVSLIMLWEGIAGIPFSLVAITLPYLLVMGIGGALWWRKRGNSAETSPEDAKTAKASFFDYFALLILVAVSAAILFNAVYWPFHRDDALGIYVPHAHDMYTLRSLIPLTGADSLYHAYPMLISSLYTYTYIASGWENEYLAKLVGTLLSVGCLPVAYLLGHLIGGKRAAWLSALLLAFTPAFGRWASAGYVDLPMAFFYGLSALFAIRLWRSGSWRDALLAGLMIGLAAWTKNAALIGVPLLGLWLMWLLIKKRIRFSVAALSLMACALVAAPWYIRNLIGAGFIIPGTAWTDQAQRTVDMLLVFFTRFDNFGLSGWIAIVGVIWGTVLVIRSRGNRPAPLVALLWSVPFFAAWWLFVSYDPRFLLLFLPLLCALGSWWLASLWTKIPPRWHPALRIALTGIALVLTVQTLWFSIEYKDDLLRNPVMSDQDKHEVVQTR